jgi:uncharacterized protein (TIGR02001 family)
MNPIPVNNEAVTDKSANNNIDKLQSLGECRHFIAAILPLVLVVSVAISVAISVPCYSGDRVSSRDDTFTDKAVIDNGVIANDESPAWRPNVYVTWTSDYVYRGVSLTGSNPTWQGGADIAHRSGVFAGVWTSAIDFSPPVGPNTEHNVFAGYSHDFGMAWSGSVRFTRFDFRGGQVGPDNAFNQWQVDVQYNKATSLHVYQADNTYGMRFASSVVELQQVVPIGDHWLLNGLFGQWDGLEKLGYDHYNYVEFGGSWSTQHVNVSLQYHHADSRGRSIYLDAAKPGWLMSATYRIF